MAGKTEGKHCSVCNKVLVGQTMIPAKGHTEVTDPAVPATCEVAGKTEGKHCSVCNKVLVGQTEVPATGHHWDDGKITTEPTCEDKGVKTYTCTVCHTTRTEELPAKGHTEVTDPAVPATCEVVGKTEGKHCSVCNKVLVEQTMIPAKGHTEVTDPAVPATCEVAGKTEGKHCSVCNKVLVEQTMIPAKGHTEVIDPAVPATCEVAGKTEGKHCSVCNKVLVEQTEVPATGHHWDDGKITTEPTCEDKGVKTFTCTVCHDTKAEEIPAKGHEWDDGVVTDRTHLRRYGCKDLYLRGLPRDQDRRDPCEGAHRGRGSRCGIDLSEGRTVQGISLLGLQ